LQYCIRQVVYITVFLILLLVHGNSIDFAKVHFLNPILQSGKMVLPNLQLKLESTFISHFRMWQMHRPIVYFIGILYIQSVALSCFEIFSRHVAYTLEAQLHRVRSYPHDLSLYKEIHMVK